MINNTFSNISLGAQTTYNFFIQNFDKKSVTVSGTWPMQQQGKK